MYKTESNPAKVAPHQSTHSHCRTMRYYSLVAAILAPIALLALNACSPAMNWRVISNSDSGYSATFPDKPVVASRDLNLAGLKVPLTLQAAVVEGAYFAVGVVELKGDLAPKGKELNDALIQALANNVKVEKAQVEQKPWAGLPAVDWVSANGTLPDGSKARAVGRFFQHQNKLYEVILVGPDHKVDSATVTQFFTGFKLLGL
jgi:hypothetical protein